jgi:hypothetical protein
MSLSAFWVALFLTLRDCKLDKKEDLNREGGVSPSTTQFLRIFVAGFLRHDDMIRNDFLESKKKVGKGQNLEQAVLINHDWLASRAITNLYSCPSGPESNRIARAST